MLAAIARDIFSVSATGVDVERLFNPARDICYYRRGSLHATTIQDLMMLIYVNRSDIEEEQLAFIRAYKTEYKIDIQQEDTTKHILQEIIEISEGEGGRRRRRRRLLYSIIQSEKEIIMRLKRRHQMRQEALRKKSLCYLSNLILNVLQGGPEYFRYSYRDILLNIISTFIQISALTISDSI